jgi:hypothetical protein
VFSFLFDLGEFFYFPPNLFDDPLALRPTWQQIHAARSQTLETKCYPIHRLSGLSPPQLSGDRTQLLVKEAGPPDTTPLAAGAPHCLNFPAGLPSDSLPFHDHFLWPPPAQTSK